VPTMTLLLKSRTVLKVFMFSFLLTSFRVYASAQDMTVFGMKLGEAITVPECPRIKVPYDKSKTRYDTGKITCYQRTAVYGSLSSDGEADEKTFKKNPPPPLVTENVVVSFAYDEKPEIVFSDATAEIIDGKLEGITFGTGGIYAADSTLKRLKDKYGDKMTLVPRVVQNQMGAAYKVSDAAWTFPNLSVTFLSVTDRLDGGVVIIKTKIAKDREEQLRKQQRDKNPL
jgi:hypothetical protein